MMFSTHNPPFANSVFVRTITEVALFIINRGKDVDHVEITMSPEAAKAMAHVLPKLKKITATQHRLIKVTWPDRPALTSPVIEGLGDRYVAFQSVQENGPHTMVTIIGGPAFEGFVTELEEGLGIEHVDLTEDSAELLP